MHSFRIVQQQKLQQQKLQQNHQTHQSANRGSNPKKKCSNFERFKKMKANWDQAVECLRALVEPNAWDYCIVWKLGDDPSSFIEWRGCCCIGGNVNLENFKEETGKDQSHNFVQCRDEHVKHPIRTQACQKLSKFPSSIPLYSGIHGEVVMSNKARWHVNSSKTKSKETIGTQVLVPVAGGLVELFSTKLVQENQQIIDFITAQYISVEPETMSSRCCTPHKPFLNDSLNNLPASVSHLKSVPNLQRPSFAFEGSSTSSNLTKDYQLLNMGSGFSSYTTSPEKSSGRHPGNSNSIKTRGPSYGFGNAIRAAEVNENLRGRKKTGKEQYYSKNLITERNRRNRISHGLLTLRSLVPNISKMNKTSTLGDAYNYIQELQKTVEEYQAELRDLEKQEGGIYTSVQDVPNSSIEREITDHQPIIKRGHSRFHSSTIDNKQGKVEIEVSQIGRRDFLVKIISTQKRGGFLRLMQAMDYFGLQVTDANVTTSKGLVLNLLKVEALSREVEPTTLKNALMELFHQDD